MNIAKESAVRLFSSRPSLFSFNRHFFERACLGLIIQLTSREKVDCKQSKQEVTDPGLEVCVYMKCLFQEVSAYGKSTA